MDMHATPAVSFLMTYWKECLVGKCPEVRQLPYGLLKL